MPSNIWLRLEPCSTNENFEGGLHAAIHDPLWMLGRQWQLGEFQLEDAASPVYAELAMDCTPLTRYSFDAKDMESLPLETLVEREAVRVSGKFQPRLAAEAGLQFLRILESRGGTEMMRKAVVEKFPLPPPDKKLLAERDPNIDHNTLNFLRVMFGRAPDGELIYRLVQDTQTRQTWLQSFQQAERTLLEKTIPIWKEWYETLFSEPQANESPWRPNRLEYGFDVATKIANEEVVLTASEYTGGHLDWYSFNIRQSGTLGAATGLTENITRNAIPMPINYPGMPASRYWEFEDARVDFGAMAAGRQQLAKLLLIDFALISGDDWFIIPVMVPVGRLCNTHTLKVWDTFGEVQSITSAYGIDSETAKKTGRQDKELPWSMFQLSFDPPSNAPAKFNLFLPPALGTSLNGAPVEELLLLRDEMANMAWAVERQVEGPLGQAFNRSEAFFLSRKPQAPPSGFASEENRPPLIYRLESEVPPHWISLQPDRITSNSPAMWLKPYGDAQGRILAEKEPIHEEEVPREGAYVTRSFQYTRWIDGKTYLWIGRRKGVGRGEGSSGLQFDRLEPPTKQDD